MQSCAVEIFIPLISHNTEPTTALKTCCTPEGILALQAGHCTDLLPAQPCNDLAIHCLHTHSSAFLLVRKEFLLTPRRLRRMDSSLWEQRTFCMKPLPLLIDGLELVGFSYSWLDALFAASCFSSGQNRRTLPREAEGTYSRAESFLSQRLCINSKQQHDVAVNSTLHNLSGACTGRPGNACVLSFPFYCFSYMPCPSPSSLRVPSPFLKIGCRFLAWLLGKK